MTETPDCTESVFAAAVALASAAERAAYLDQACAGDAALRGQVEALLRRTSRRAPAGSATAGWLGANRGPHSP